MRPETAVIAVKSVRRRAANGATAPKAPRFEGSLIGRGVVHKSTETRCPEN
jgi:hypothetical protein